jgi:hypothetical protein
MIKEQTAEHLSFHPALRMAAKVISYIFHPLFIPVYMGWFFICVLRLFPAQDAWHQTLLIIQFFVNYTLLPLVTVLISKGLGFIDSIYLKTQKDRIIPYIATMIFYFWVWYVFKNQSFPKEAVMFSLAVFLTTCLGVFFNTYFKVSMHGLSIGVVITLMFILSLTSTANFGPYLSTTLFIAGLVCTARLINNDHRPFEVYAGLFLGSLSQLIAWMFV